MKTFLSLLGFDAQKHSVKVEMMAGLTTFLTIYLGCQPDYPG